MLEFLVYFVHDPALCLAGWTPEAITSLSGLPPASSHEPRDIPGAFSLPSMSDLPLSVVIGFKDLFIWVLHLHIWFKVLFVESM